TVIDSTWSFTPGEGDTGDVTPQIVARDPSGSTDTLTIDLAITAEDRVPPTLTRITPARDTVTVASSTYQITISARDPSGVASITCAMGADTFPVTSSDTLYTSTVAGLRPATLNQIAFIATDASARANRCTLYVHVTYDSTVADNVPPIITLLSPARDTIIGVDSCAIRVRCTDQSGVASVTISAGSATVPAAREADNVFSATIKTLIGGQNTTVTITATDSAATPNAGTSTVRIKYDNDRTRPSLALISPVTGSRVGTSSVTVQVSCKDASGIASLTCSMGSNLFTVTKSSSADSLYSATITGLVAGQFNQITFVAVDSSLNANRDSLVVSINYDNDTTGPAITRVTPAGESVTTNASSYTITVSCTDPSGVASVIAAMGAQSFTGGKGTGNNWTIPVTGLTVTTVNTVTVTAIDSSLKANRSTLPVYINYDPTMEDTVGPTIRQVSGPVSGSIVAAPVVTIVDSITDPSGIDSVYWTRNGGVKKIMSPVTGNAGHYSLKDTLTEGTHDTIRVTAVDKSTRRNRSAQTIILQYINAPAITTQPVSKAVCGGSQAIFSVIAAGTAPLSYQWRKGASTFTNINGAIAPSCTLNAVSSADNGTVLSCVISNESGTSVTSNLCTLTVNTVSTKPTAAATPASVCPGDSSTLSVSAGTLGTGAAWKWYTSKTGSAITTTRVAPSTAAWYFVRGEGTCGNSPWDSIRITLNTISTKPTPTASATDICPGTTCTLSVSAGTLGTGASWKWYTAKTGTALSSTTVTPTAATWYFVRGEGTCGNSAWDSVRIAVKSRPTITTPPASVSVCPTLQAVFTVTASGTSPLTYQWRKGSAALPNATTPSCTLTNVQSIDNNSVITCAVTNECGTTVSNPCTLRVNILSVVPTSISASPTSICPGGSATLSVAGGTLGTGAQWHWYSLGCGLGPVGTGSSIIVNPNSTTTYYVRAEGGCGTTACVSRSLTVNDAPTITTQPPAACTLCINSSFGLNVPVVASGTGLTYQWYRNGAALSDDAVFGGTTTASLYIKGYNTTDRSGSYYCIITNASDCTVRSNTTVVTMRNDC
ncbi:MAG: hypothetical protein JXA71_13670, partial [Chitinispirillaceae bacterium]|nr:hypothetical protein [Chitinispirillaceae bacterium]